MANEPVQVVLNPEALSGPRDRPRPVGNGTDFYENRSGFEAHRTELARSVSGILSVLENAARRGNFDGLGYVKVTMAPSAIAKSHRAQKRLFQSAWTPHVGTGAIGEPIYAVTPTSLQKVLAEIMKAEIEVGLKLNAQTGEMSPNPSRNRCEVSAVERIELWTMQDKRTFSAAEGAAWLARASTGGRYLVETFRVATAGKNVELARAEHASFVELQETLLALGTDTQAIHGPGKGSRTALSVRVHRPGTPGRLGLDPADRNPRSDALPGIQLQAASSDPSVHQDVLSMLEQNPLVRSISLPPEVQRNDFSSAVIGDVAGSHLFQRDEAQTHLGRVGVIDGGVAGPIDDWVEARWGQLAEADRDAGHGTFISGLLVCAGQLNPYLQKQRHGCIVFDIDVLPADPGGTGVAFANYYPDGIFDFLDEVEEAVREFRQNHGVRIFNFSMNFSGPGDSSHYGYAAARLDDMAVQYDVIFVVSAGNLDSNAQRAEWHPEPEQAIASLVNDPVSIVSEPGESLYNVSVSALNPPGLDGQVPFALARYSRRGPGLRGATKPDFAHIGGSGSPVAGDGSGLLSIDEHGRVVADAGTSFAAPLVARRLADLDALIEADVSRETLLALLVHHARTPEIMRHKSILPISRNLIGFGVPLVAEEMLNRDDSEITLVFNSTIQHGEQASLVFAWPESLVSDGKCRGYARLTLVARPVLAYEHGDERIRVNVGARLMQEDKNGGWKNGLRPVNSGPPSSQDGRTERDLLKEAMKWQVVKCFEARLTGRGPTSNWKFVVDYLTRADEAMPMDGVEFAAVLTISDPKGVAPVFQQMRQELSQLGIRTDDIRTSVRSRVQQ